MRQFILKLNRIQAIAYGIGAVWLALLLVIALVRLLGIGNFALLGFIAAVSTFFGLIANQIWMSVHDDKRRRY